MNKLNVVRFAVVLGFLAVGFGAPLATVALNAPSAKAATFEASAPVRQALPEIPAPPAVQTVNVPEVKITGRLQSRPAAKPAKPASAQGCYRRPLEQGRGDVTICG